MIKLEFFLVKGTEGDGQFPVLKALNFFSSRPSSFTVSVGGEGFIDLFLGFLDFPGKSAEVSRGNS
jgi:hypothetical protein